MALEDLEVFDSSYILVTESGERRTTDGRKAAVFG